MDIETSGLDRIDRGTKNRATLQVPQNEPRVRALEIIRPVMERSGFLAVLNRCSTRCRLCGPMGCLNADERSPESLREKMESIRKAGLTLVTFPPNTLLYAHREAILSNAAELGLVPVLRISPYIGIVEHRDAILGWLAEGGRVEAVIDHVWNEGEIEFLRRLNGLLGEGLSILIAPTRNADPLALLDSLPANLASRAEFIFAVDDGNSQDFLSCDEVRTLTQELKEQRPDLQIRPYRGFDLLNTAASSEIETEPDLHPTLKSSSLNPSPQISVIIPSYNRKNTVINTLRHLQRQDLAPDQFEVIVVDDGSDDGTLERLREHMARSSSRFNFKYFIFPRMTARRNGDAQFRAGIARNLGAKNSTGRILVFLDSDILVPPDFLTDTLHQHQEADVVQFENIQIPFEKSSQRPRYQELDVKKHSVRTDHGYWEKFYAAAEWRALPDFWRYLSASCVALKREHFLACGGFARAFHSYGFEDMLLGWQLAKLDLCWRVRRKPVFHLGPSDEESEYGNSRFRRPLVMAKSAKIFYLLTLEESFYHDFFPLLGRQVRTRLILHRMSRWLIGRAIIWPAYELLQLWREPEQARRFMKTFSEKAKAILRQNAATKERLTATPPQAAPDVQEAHPETQEIQKDEP